MIHLQEFNFSHNGEFNSVRTLVGEQGQPLFVANDVAELLGYAKPRNAISAHCKGALIQGVPTAGGIQQMTLIPESDVYRLIFRSQLASAEKFEAWVMEEVLPAIRQQGFYQMQATVKSAAPIISLQKQALTIITKLQKEQDPALRSFLHGMLHNVSCLLGQTAPPLLAIGKTVDPDAEPDLVVQFWQNLASIQKTELLNHSPDPAFVAFSINEYLDACQQHNLPVPHKPTLIKELKASKRLRDSNITVRSKLTGQSLKCWVFTAGGEA